MHDKKVKVTEGLFCYTAMLAGAVERAYLYPDTEALGPQDYELAVKILEEISSILEARKRREAYTAYKTAEKGTADREKLRQEYLDMMGIHRDWRTKTEKRHEEL